MSIFSRMADIINSNISSMLDKAEDPQKMIRLIIQEMEETLVEVRSSSARVIADKKTATRALTRMQDEVDGWEEKAKLAISKGREDLARAALAEKQLADAEAAAISTDLGALDEQLDHLNEEVSQLQQKLNDAKAKQKTLMLRHKTVNDRMKVKRQIHRDALDEAFVKFEKFERRMDDMEGQVESMDVGRGGKPDLATEIDSLADEEKINDEMARLKAEVSTGK